MPLIDKALTLLCLLAGFGSLLYGLDLIHASLPWVVGGVCLILVSFGGILRNGDAIAAEKAPKRAAE